MNSTNVPKTLRLCRACTKAHYWDKLTNKPVKEEKVPQPSYVEEGACGATTKKVKVALKHTQMTWDWKDQPSAEELQEVLAPFGVVVTDHPASEGQDSYGFIFSNRPLTEDELEEAADSQ